MWLNWEIWEKNKTGLEDIPTEGYKGNKMVYWCKWLAVWIWNRDVMKYGDKKEEVGVRKWKKNTGDVKMIYLMAYGCGRE